VALRSGDRGPSSGSKMAPDAARIVDCGVIPASKSEYSFSLDISDLAAFAVEGVKTTCGCVTVAQASIDSEEGMLRGTLELAPRNSPSVEQAVTFKLASESGALLFVPVQVVADVQGVWLESPAVEFVGHVARGESFHVSLLCIHTPGDLTAFIEGDGLCLESQSRTKTGSIEECEFVFRVCGSWGSYSEEKWAIRFVHSSSSTSVCRVLRTATIQAGYCVKPRSVILRRAEGASFAESHVDVLKIMDGASHEVRSDRCEAVGEYVESWACPSEKTGLCLRERKVENRNRRIVSETIDVSVDGVVVDRIKAIVY